MEEVKADPVECSLGDPVTFPDRISRAEAFFSSCAYANYNYHVNGWLAGNLLSKILQDTVVEKYVLKNRPQTNEVALCLSVCVCGGGGGGFKHISIYAFSHKHLCVFWVFLRYIFYLKRFFQKKLCSVYVEDKNMKKIPECGDETRSHRKSMRWAGNGLTVLLPY